MDGGGLLYGEQVMKEEHVHVYVVFLSYNSNGDVRSHFCDATSCCCGPIEVTVFFIFDNRVMICQNSMPTYCTLQYMYMYM